MTLPDLEQKLSQNPNSPLFARLAKECLSAGRVEEARQLCMSGLQLYPSYATAHLVLAQCYRAEQNTTKALEYIQEARTFLPDSIYLKTLYDEWSRGVAELPIELPQPIVTKDIEPQQEVEALQIVESIAPVVEALEEMFPETFPREVVELQEAFVERINKNEEIITEEPLPIQEIQSQPVEITEEIVSEALTESMFGAPPITESTLHVAEEINLVEEIFSDSAVVPPSPTIELPVESQITSTTFDVQLPQHNDDDGRIVSKTLAEIYASQGAYAEAILTYQLLKSLRPAQTAEYDLRIKELEPKLHEKPSLYSADKSLNG